MRRRRPCLPALWIAAALALLLAGCGYSGSHAAQVRQWVSQSTYFANAKQVASDARHVELAQSEGTPLQLRTVCGGLSSDAGTLYSTLVSPDHLLTHELSSSMEDFFHAAETCAVASSTTSPAVMRALRETRAGIAELLLADTRLASFGVNKRALAKVASNARK